MDKWKKLRKQNLGAIPQESSTNLNAPELAPSRSTNKVNIRTKPLNFKVSEEFYWQLKDLALKQKCLMVEVVEKSLECYKQSCSEVNASQPTKKLTHCVKVFEFKPKKPKPKLSPYKIKGYVCDKCGDEYYDEVAYSYAPNLDEINNYKTYCADCVR